MDEAISREAVITEIGRWAGYLDDDMIRRIQIGIKRLQPIQPVNNSENPNSSDVISRHAAIDALRDYLVGKRCPDDGTLTCRLIENEVINKLLPIQPKRGKWIADKGQQTLMKNFIEMGEVWRVCSVCGAGHMIGHKYAIDKAYHDRHHNFCPNCGADMREVTT